jgi:hypothetical protein
MVSRIAASKGTVAAQPSTPQPKTGHEHRGAVCGAGAYHYM